MKPERLVDLVVVGGGPAGCAAALTARRLGQAVAMVDPCASDVRHVVERLAPVTRQPLADWGLLDRLRAPIARECSSVVSAWEPDVLPRITHAMFDPYGGGWIVERHAFDRLLRREAELCGAALLRGQAVAIQACRDGWTIEYRGHESGGSVSAARLVVAAGGGTSLTRSLTGRTNPVERWVAVLGRARHCDPAWQDDACLVVEKTMDGWMYGMPAPAGGAFVGVCVAGQLLSSGQNPIDLWRRTLSRSRLRGACRQGHDVWCCPMRGPVAADVAGDSWAIAGDAAQWVDPLSGLGVAFALESGRRAVEEPATYAAWVRAFRAQHDETRTALYGTQFSAV